jgi:hypothetical protein
MWVRIKSRSTSARLPRTASLKRPVLVPVSAHGSAKERNCELVKLAIEGLPIGADVVTVTRIDRLARSTFDLFAIARRRMNQPEHLPREGNRRAAQPERA